MAGAFRLEAQQHAIARFGGPEAAAALFGSSLTGLVYRYVLGLVRKNTQKRAWAVLRSPTDADARIPNSTWTVADAAAHLAVDVPHHGHPWGGPS
ncbi:MAG: hypothetical protein M3N68_02350 [Actinomycetota bacterium]|nr:hypothetical protein [Actinomycetota bacterium]